MSLRSVWTCLLTAFLVAVVETGRGMTELWWGEIRGAVKTAVPRAVVLSPHPHAGPCGKGISAEKPELH